MSIAERIDKLCQSEGSQKIVAEKTGIKQGVLSAIINRGSQVRSDTLRSILIAYPTLNARWLITGQGEMWDGPPPSGLKDIQPPASPTPNQELFNQLLVQKLQEVARELKTRDPEAYRKLGLEELVDKAGNED
ncbi:MAG: helix-turn-helix transcriptional regulator [Phaeodactylibacter sp.]|nr:helix-turn-helix transcriptional regulator [Phaeodactylibacter sp.]